MFRRLALGATLALAVSAASLSGSARAEENTPLLDGKFSFDGLFGTFDRASLQRGLQVYTEVCSTCHGLYELSYRDLTALGYTEDQVKAYAAKYQVKDIGDDGSDIMRPAKPSDRFVHPFANENAARDANGGALPPDLALIAKSRKGEANYVYSILQGYRTAPADVTVLSGQYYNIYYPGEHKFAMPQPLTAGAVTFEDGTANDLNQEAHDIATFLAWAANPELEERHELGVRVIVFLALTSVVLYFAKRWIWRKVH